MPFRSHFAAVDNTVAAITCHGRRTISVFRVEIGESVSSGKRFDGSKRALTRNIYSFKHHISTIPFFLQQVPRKHALKSGRERISTVPAYDYFLPLKSRARGWAHNVIWCQVPLAAVHAFSGLMTKRQDRLLHYAASGGKRNAQRSSKVYGMTTDSWNVGQIYMILIVFQYFISDTVMIRIQYDI